MADDAAVKEPTSVHNIPEDVAEIIVDLVKGWAEQTKGTSDQREAGRRERDSTLLGISQSCKEGRDLYYDHLLLNLTVSRQNTFSLFQMFKNGKINGLKIKTLHCAFATMKELQSPFSTLKEKFEQIVKLSQFPRPSTDKASMALVKHQTSDYNTGLKIAMQTIYEKLENLQVLIVEDPLLGFHFLTKVGDRFLPQPFLTKSLKKLYIASSADKFCSLPAKSVIFLLIFGQVLERVAIGFIIDRESFHYLSEYAPTFKGLSKAKELAIGFQFSSEEKNSGSWWGGPSIHNQRNRKTSAVHDFLLVTNQLYSLEISDLTPERSGDVALVEADCLSSLTRSDNSLRHLRFFLNGSATPSMPGGLPSFKNLVNLSLEIQGLAYFHKNLPLEIQGLPDFLNSKWRFFPWNVSVVSLSYYSTQAIGQLEHRFLEERYLKRVIESVKSTALTRVVVPEFPIDNKGEMIEEGTNWLENRKELENSVIFKGGKVKIIKYRVGDVVGLDCKENPISMYRWLSP